MLGCYTYYDVRNFLPQRFRITKKSEIFLGFFQPIKFLPFGSHLQSMGRLYSKRLWSHFFDYCDQIYADHKLHLPTVQLTLPVVHEVLCAHRSVLPACQFALRVPWGAFAPGPVHFARSPICFLHTPIRFTRGPWCSCAQSNMCCAAARVTLIGFERKKALTEYLSGLFWISCKIPNLYPCLEGIQLVVPTLLLNEFIVFAALRYLALLDHQNLISLPDGTQPVGNDKSGASFQ